MKRIALTITMIIAICVSTLYTHAQVADSPDSPFRYYRESVQKTADFESSRFMDALDTVLGKFTQQQANAFAKALIVELGLLKQADDVSTAPKIPAEEVQRVRETFATYFENSDELIAYIKANGVIKPPEEVTP